MMKEEKEMCELSKKIFTKIEEIFSKKIPKKIAVALSGGADSLALTLLLAEFCFERNIELIALTVDHKMRQASKTEARALTKILAKKKISHKILEISAQEVPTKNIEASLREARYNLLSDFCLKNKIKFLFLGHHIGDVAENFLIRLFRGSGLDGLSTIAQTLERDGVTLVRPLLEVNKDELKDFLRAKKMSWFEDETNADEKFLRNKIRKFLSEFPEKNFIEKRIKNAADEISKMRDLFNDKMQIEVAEIVEERADGAFLINLEKFKKTEEKIALKMLALLLMKVGKKKYKPRLENLKNFYRAVIETPNFKRKNFYGCMLEKHDAVSLRLRKE
jgi:tRNA(Ile)-lysidine synthase